MPDDNVPNPVPIPPDYWNAAGAMYAYIFGNLVLQGIDVLGESQLVGYPTQFPSVSEVNWSDGTPNARYWAVWLLVRNFFAGDKMFQTSSSSSSLFALGFQHQQQRRILLINKLNQQQSLVIPGITLGFITYCDTTTGSQKPPRQAINSDKIVVGPWAVVVIDMPNN